MNCSVKRDNHIIHERNDLNGIYRVCGCEKFIEISGISKDDFEKKISCNEGFQEACMYRFGKGAKRYIKVDKAIDYIENQLMIKESDL